MKPFPILALCASLALAAGSVLAAPEVGQPAPAFTVTDTDGKQHALADFAGKTVVLEWTNHECPFVAKHYGAGNMQAQQKAATAAGVVWLTVNSSAPGKQGNVSPERARELMAESGWAGTAYTFDPTGVTGRAYGARTTPHMYVIDGDGVLRYMGGIDSNPSADQADISGATQYVRVALDQMAAGQAVADSNTRPYGCGIKYPDA
jgi:peroxiredoxin